MSTMLQEIAIIIILVTLGIAAINRLVLSKTRSDQFGMMMGIREYMIGIMGFITGYILRIIIENIHIIR